MPGRPKKPTALKLLAGNPGKRPLNADEPMPELGEPEMPKGMSVAARREWRRIVPELLANGVLTIVDGKALGEYCKAIGLSEVYYRVTLKEPMIQEPIVNKQGDIVGYKTKVNPANIAYANMSKLANTFLTQFGLSPSSRPKLHASKRQATDPVEDALNEMPADTMDADIMQFPSFENN